MNRQRILILMTASMLASGARNASASCSGAATAFQNGAAQFLNIPTGETYGANFNGFFYVPGCGAIAPAAGLDNGLNTSIAVNSGAPLRKVITASWATAGTDGCINIGPSGFPTNGDGSDCTSPRVWVVALTRKIGETTTGHTAELYLGQKEYGGTTANFSAMTHFGVTATPVGAPPFAQLLIPFPNPTLTVLIPTSQLRFDWVPMDARGYYADPDANTPVDLISGYRIYQVDTADVSGNPAPPTTGNVGAGGWTVTTNVAGPATSTVTIPLTLPAAGFRRWYAMTPLFGASGFQGGGIEGGVFVPWVGSNSGALGPTGLGVFATFNAVRQGQTAINATWTSNTETNVVSYQLLYKPAGGIGWKDAAPPVAPTGDGSSYQQTFQVKSRVPGMQVQCKAVKSDATVELSPVVTLP